MFSSFRRFPAQTSVTGMVISLKFALMYSTVISIGLLTAPPNRTWNKNTQRVEKVRGSNTPPIQCNNAAPQTLDFLYIYTRSIFTCKSTSTEKGCTLQMKAQSGGRGRGDSCCDHGSSRRLMIVTFPRQKHYIYEITWNVKAIIKPSNRRKQQQQQQQQQLPNQTRGKRPTQKNKNRNQDHRPQAIYHFFSWFSYAYNCTKILRISLILQVYKCEYGTIVVRLHRRGCSP